MSVVCKMYVQSSTNSPLGTTTFQLGVVCRGEENKEWAAATPSGSMKHPSSEVLDDAFEADSHEVYVTIVPDTEGEWELQSCAFQYAGCQVIFRLPSKAPKYEGGELTLGVNASPATQVLRDAFAASLTDGKPAKFRLDIALA